MSHNRMQYQLRQRQMMGREQFVLPTSHDFPMLYEDVETVIYNPQQYKQLGSKTYLPIMAF